MRYFVEAGFATGAGRVAAGFECLISTEVVPPSGTFGDGLVAGGATSGSSDGMSCLGGATGADVPRVGGESGIGNWDAGISLPRGVGLFGMTPVGVPVDAGGGSSTAGEEFVAGTVGVPGNCGKEPADGPIGSGRVGSELPAGRTGVVAGALAGASGFFTGSVAGTGNGGIESGFGGSLGGTAGAVPPDTGSGSGGSSAFGSAGLGGSMGVPFGGGIAGTSSAGAAAVRSLVVSVLGHCPAIAAIPPSDTPSPTAMIFQRDSVIESLRPWGAAGGCSRASDPAVAAQRRELPGHTRGRSPCLRHFPRLRT
jgi:hypothetical protein